VRRIIGQDAPEFTASDPAWDGIPEDWQKHAALAPATPEGLARRKAAEPLAADVETPARRRSTP
jgi:hypothetical protein